MPSIFVKTPDKMRCLLNAVQAILRDFANGGVITANAFHAWPQAHKIDIELGYGQQFRVIGTLKNMSGYVSAMVPGAAVERTPHENSAVQRRDRCWQNVDEVFELLEPEDMNLICQMLEVDFKCFGFSVPNECLGNA